MIAYMVASRKTVEPFGDHPRDCLIMNRRLAEHQQEALHVCGVESRSVDKMADINDSREHIAFTDSLYFSAELLGEFLARSRRMGTRTVCSAKLGVATLRSVISTQDTHVFDDHIEYGLYYEPGGAMLEASPIVIDVDQFREVFPMPVHMFGSDEYPVQMTDLLIAQIDHWTNLLAMNVATLLSGGARLRKLSKARLLGLALKARSFNQWRIAGKLNSVGRGCDVHPTAYVEGSTLGNGVRVGAGSIIRESYIGDNTYIANRVTVDLSTVGNNCFVRDGATVQYSVLYPGSYISNRLVSLSLCGRDTFVGDGAVLTDFRFDGRPISVMKDGKAVSTENTFVGCCLGHRVYLGACTALAPGRAVPNDMRICLDETRIIQRCQPGDSLPGYRIVGPPPK